MMMNREKFINDHEGGGVAKLQLHLLKYFVNDTRKEKETE